MKKILIPISLLFLLTLAAVQVKADIPGCDFVIGSAPYEVNESNKVYCLSSNVSVASGDGIDFAIGIDNATLDCKGLSIIGGGTGDGAGLDLTAGGNTMNTPITDSLIENCIIERFGNGASLFNGSNNSFMNVTVKNNTYYGFYVQLGSYNNFTNITINGQDAIYSTGFFTWTTSNNILTDIKAHSNQFGLVLYDGSANNNITNSNISNNIAVDVSLFSSDCTNNLTNVTVSGNAPLAYYTSTVSLSDQNFSELILCGANNSVLDNITIGGLASHNNRLEIMASNNVTLTNSVSSDNYDGLYLKYSYNINVTNFTANSNTYGLNIGYSYDSIFTDIMLKSNTFNGVWLYSSDNNTLRDILANSSSGSYYLTDSSNNTFVNDTALNGNYGFHVLLGSNYNRFTNCTANNSTAEGFAVASSYYNNFTNSTANGNNDGFYLEQDGSYNLFENSTANGNLNTGFIILSGSNYNNFTNITANGNFHGFQLNASSNNIFKNITTNDGQGYGFYTNSSTYNTFANITSKRNFHGFYIDFGSNYNNFTDIVANDNVNGPGAYGIILNGNSNYNRITNMVANNNSQMGILLISSSNNSISNVTANSNQYTGFYLYLSHNNTLTNSTANGNPRGFALDSSSRNNVSRNHISNSSFAAIRVEYSIANGERSENNTVYNNLINNSIFLSFCSWNAVYDTCLSEEPLSNYWNTTRLAGDRIYSAGGSLGGNYWTNSTGNGYSDTCADANADGFCDYAYDFYNQGICSGTSYSNPGNCSSNADYLPYSDITPSPVPSYSNNQSQLASAYGPTSTSNFSVTWYDDDSGSLSGAYLENNFSGSLVNTSMNGSYPNYYYNTTPLKAGTYQYRFIANDSTNNQNATPASTFTIAKSSIQARLYLNGNEANRSYNKTDTINLTATTNGTGFTVYLYSNFTGSVALIGSGTNSASNLTNTSAMNLASYYILANTTNNENYSSSQVNYNIILYDQKASMYSNNQTNSTTTNSPINFSLVWSDNDALSGYIFGTNNSGAWSNSSFIPMTGTTNTSWNITTSNSTAGQVIGWRFYANDSSNNWNASEVFSMIGTCTESWSCTDWSGCSGGTQTRTCTDAGVCGTNISRPTESQSCGGSTGGGGGGGGFLPTNDIKVTLSRGKANITILSIKALGIANVSIAKYEDVSFRQLNISAANNTSNIKIFISKLAGMPASLDLGILSVVYQNIQIEKTNFTDADIGYVRMMFAVNKSWLADNGIDFSNISLYRWTTNWNELPTNYLSNSSSEVFYSALSPGFSYFMIGTKGGVKAAQCTESWSCTDWSDCTDEQQTRTCTDSNICGTNANEPTGSQTCEAEANINNQTDSTNQNKTADSFWIWPVAIAALAVVFVISFVMFRKKNVNS